MSMQFDSCFDDSNEDLYSSEVGRPRMRPDEKRNKSFRMKINKVEDKYIDKLAKQYNCTRSDIVRAGLYYLKRKDPEDVSFIIRTKTWEEEFEE